MTIEDFINQPFPPRGCNTWIKTPEAEIYVRLSQRCLDGQTLTPCLDISNVEVRNRHRGKGRFTHWLHHVEKLAAEKQLAIFVENVLMERFRKFFLRFGYKEDSRYGLFCCYKPAPLKKEFVFLH